MSEASKGVVEVWDGPKVVILPRTGGGEVRLRVRKIGRSRLNDIQIAAGVRPGLIGTVNKFTELRVRAAIVGAEGLTDAETLEKVKYASEKHPELGSIAAAEVFDALSTLDCLVVIAVAENNLPTADARAFAETTLTMLAAGEDVDLQRRLAAESRREDGARAKNSDAPPGG